MRMQLTPVVIQSSGDGNLVLIRVMTDQGNSPEKKNKQKEGQRHDHKMAEVDEAGKDGGFDAGANMFHITPGPQSLIRTVPRPVRLQDGP